jgi:hypothetical protein
MYFIGAALKVLQYGGIGWVCQRRYTLIEPWDSPEK